MAGIYCAAIYCDACVEHIKRGKKHIGEVPKNPEDTRSYDSDEYPKDCDDDETSDVPEHCGSGRWCLDPLVFEGEKYGHFFGNALTNEGAEYVAETVREDIAAGCTDSIACKVWLPHYVDDYPQLKGLLQ